jgi:hypothetical protein
MDVSHSCSYHITARREHLVHWVGSHDQSTHCSNEKTPAPGISLPLLTELLKLHLKPHLTQANQAVLHIGIVSLELIQHAPHMTTYNSYNDTSWFCCPAGHQQQLWIVKLSLCWTKYHAMKTYWGSGGIAPRILDFGTRWRWVVSFTSRPLYPQGKSRWYPLDRRLGGPQSWYGRGGEEKNSQPLPGLKPTIIQLTAQRYITELSQL